MSRGRPGHHLLGPRRDRPGCLRDLAIDDAPAEASGEDHCAAAPQRSWRLPALPELQTPRAIVLALATTAGLAISDNPLDRARPLAVTQGSARGRWPLLRLVGSHPAAPSVVYRRPALGEPTARRDARPHRRADRRDRSSSSEPRVRSSPSRIRPSSPGATTCPSPRFGPLGTSASQSQPRRRPSGERLFRTRVEEGIFETAEGNPLFIEEIVTRLVEAGRAGTGRLVAGERPDRRLASTPPDTIHGCSRLRIDGLRDAETKRTVQ